MYTLLEASVEDIPVLVGHHHRMFEEIWNFRNLVVDRQKLDDMDAAYQDKLESEFVDGTCKAWLVKEGDHIIASGAISVVSMVPTPVDSSCRVAYLHSVFTENTRRKKGIAELIVRKILDYCQSKDINRVILNASEVGRPLYEKIGFKLTENAMTIILNT